MGGSFHGYLTNGIELLVGCFWLAKQDRKLIHSVFSYGDGQRSEAKRSEIGG